MKVRCTQCGAEIPIEEDAGFIQCPYCETHLFIEVDRTVRHYNFFPRIDAGSLASIMMRRLSERELFQPVHVSKSELVYFPFWQISTDQGRKLIIPASTTVIENLAAINLPAGDLKFFDPQKIASGRIIPPETLLDGALAQFKGLGLDDKAHETFLIHLPLFLIKYDYQSRSYSAAVDAVSGRVYADDYPPAPVKEKDRFFGLMMTLAFALFVIEGVFIRGFGYTILAYGWTGIILYFVIRNMLKSRDW